MTKFTEDQEEEVVLEGAVVKAEPLDDDIPYMEDNYLEPTVCLTEPEEVSGGLASVDPATVTTNTPTLALATVPPDIILIIIYNNIIFILRCPRTHRSWEGGSLLIQPTG